MYMRRMRGATVVANGVSEHVSLGKIGSAKTFLTRAVADGAHA